MTLVSFQASRQDGHPLYELLSLYRKARQALVTVQAHLQVKQVSKLVYMYYVITCILQAIKNDYNTYKSLLWKLESHTITSSVSELGHKVESGHHIFRTQIVS